MHRWIVERDDRELNQELGHFEGYSWRSFHQNATLCLAACGFLVAERSHLSPSAPAGQFELSAAEPAVDHRLRGSTREVAEP